MSAFRVGIETAEPPASREPKPEPSAREDTGDSGTGGGNDPVKDALNRLTKWIPGDMLALYVAAVTIVAAELDAPNNVPLLIIAAAVTFLYVIGSAFASAYARSAGSPCPQS